MGVVSSAGQTPGSVVITIDRTILATAKLQTMELSYAKGETVYGRGSSAQLVYVVDEGALCRVKQLSRERKSILQFLLPNDGFGYEIGRLHRDTVRALTRAKILAVETKALLEATNGDAHLSNLLFTAATRAIAIAESEALALRDGTAAEKIALFLLEMDTRLSTRGEIDLPMQKGHIAAYLGLSIETVARTLRAFRREKIIEFRRRSLRISICDKQGLLKLAPASEDFH